MPPIPSPGARNALQFVQSLSPKGHPLRAALDALVDRPSDPRTTRKAVSAIRIAIHGQLLGKADRDTIDTIAQDTSLRVLNAAAKGKPLTVAFVRQCARNLYTDHVRASASLKRDNSNFIPDATAAWNKSLEQVEVIEKLGELPRDTGNVLALRFLEDKTLQQTADLLGISMSKVYRLEKQGLREMESMLAA